MGTDGNAIGAKSLRNKRHRERIATQPGQSMGRERRPTNGPGEKCTKRNATRAVIVFAFVARLSARLRASELDRETEKTDADGED